MKPDICIKVVAFVLAMTVYPPIMMFGVLAAAIYVFICRSKLAG